ncbi:ISL3 family transposase [Parapedobacter sp. ISTM3]|uniref:ISL3 family transposase n=1 Tax=Parapedobacter sp. ISTM3 TaxID=2800130 RepID=UPI001906D8A5|nr:ISL3 family transposase [Parapedobacter sp. ISTM3]MBK1439660.1 ISL3 family transposase [Parapedobacter sp. ISTM3]
MNAEKIILDTEDHYRVVSVDRLRDCINIYVESVQAQCLCPNCCLPAGKVHSYYTRRFSDLPAFGSPCTLFLKARKFRCRTDECPVKIFTERFGDHFSAYKRKTERLAKALYNLAIQNGGRPGERLCNLLSMPASDNTLLRLVHSAPMPERPNVTELGVDDWAMKKRDRYGSILVDLSTNKPIGLLPDREEDTLSGWLKAHPGIRTVSRDRYGNYRRAVSCGAPRAIQVADRWHLLKNLGEAVRKMLEREHVAMRKARESQAVSAGAQKARIRSLASPRQHEKFRQVKDMLARNIPVREIARVTKMSRITIRKYRDCDELPRRHCTLSSGLGKHLEFISERLAAEPDLQLKQLLAELQTRGYRGAYSTLSDGLAQFGLRCGKKQRMKKVLPADSVFWRPSKAVALFFQDSDKLPLPQQKFLADLRSKSIQLDKTFGLVRDFRHMMLKERSSRELDGWIDAANDSGINEVAGFANGLLQDYQAVKNAFDTKWSNGPVEGNVNRLKTIKRQMYGRGSLDLLERRLILTPS